MSYRLFYDKVAVKLSDGRYLFMELSGDSNFFERDTDKRVRDWSAFKLKGQYLFTKEEILAFPKSILDDVIGKDRHNGVSREDIEKQFGYYAGLSVGGRYTATTTYKHFYGFFSGGIKNAIPSYEFFSSEMPINLEFVSYGSKDKNIFIVVKDEGSLIRLCERYGNDSDVYIKFGTAYEYVLKNIKRYRKRKKLMKNEIALMNSGDFYTLHSKNHSDGVYAYDIYKQRLSGNVDFYISYNIKDCMRFDTKRKAENFIKKYNLSERVVVVKIIKEAGQKIKTAEDFKIEKLSE